MCKPAPTLCIRNGCLLTLDDANRALPRGSLFIRGDRIERVEASDRGFEAADRVIDAEGACVLPGFMNAHHHLYSTPARGFAPSGAPAGNFVEILERLWWRLDAALDMEDIRCFSTVGLLDGLHAGCTTVIDHHASPSVVEGSLDAVRAAFDETGLSGCLCYEVTDRHVPGQGVEENVRFLKSLTPDVGGRLSGLFGLHASMTLGAETLERCVAEARALGAGFHAHLAEDGADQRFTRERFGCGVVERFVNAGVAGPRTVFAHGVWLEDKDMDALAASEAMVVHNPESNMNNAVGGARWLELMRHGVLVGLGTDGMSADMPAQARAAYLLQRHILGDPRVAFGEACALLTRHNRRIADRLFSMPRGVLAEGARADIAIVPYDPPTPLQSDTLCGHILYGLPGMRARHVVAGGRVVLEDGRATTLDEARLRAHARERAERLWKRIDA